MPATLQHPHRDAIALLFATLDEDDERFLEVLEPYQENCVALVAELATIAYHLGTEFRDEDELRGELLALSLAYARQG